MRRLIRAAVFALMLFASTAAVATLAQGEEPEWVDGCAALNEPLWDETYALTRVMYRSGVYFTLGDTIRIETTPPRVVHFEYEVLATFAQTGMSPLEFTVTVPLYANITSWLTIYTDDQTTVGFTVSCEPADTGATGSDPAAGSPCANLFDGRINDDPSKDCAAPVAVYVVDRRIDVYAIDPNTGEGTLVIQSGPETDEGAPDASIEESGNVLLGSAGTIHLYWLPDTGEYGLLAQYADGKPYQIVWSGDGSDLRHVTA